MEASFTHHARLPFLRPSYKVSDVMCLMLITNISRMSNVCVLIKSASLRDINSVLVSINIPCSLIVKFISLEFGALEKLFEALCVGGSKLDLKAISSIGSLHCVIGSKRSLNSAPYWLFQVQALEVPLVIYVSEEIKRNVEISPFWVRFILTSVEVRAASLIALNAYISTLGGGHFLCKHVKSAWRMALQQQAVAIALGDMELAGQCRVHLAYICMQKRG
jgi:hypothetical protein